MNMPSWFGTHYPSIEDLKELANQLGAGVGEADIPCGLYHPNIEGQKVIIIPSKGNILESAWFLAHEIGHLIQHSGPKGQMCHGKEEAQANRWAACALIPEQRIRMYGNACLDSMIGALSANYEDIPFQDCPTRELAAKIAGYRLMALQEVA